MDFNFLVRFVPPKSCSRGADYIYWQASDSMPPVRALTFTSFLNPSPTCPSPHLTSPRPTQTGPSERPCHPHDVDFLALHTRAVRALISPTSTHPSNPHPTSNHHVRISHSFCAPRPCRRAPSIAIHSRWISLRICRHDQRRWRRMDRLPVEDQRWRRLSHRVNQTESAASSSLGNSFTTFPTQTHSANHD